jgi:hypothetical protein
LLLLGLLLLLLLLLLLQPHADAFGRAASIDPSFILNFGEEVVRGQPVFVLSGLLQDLEKCLREAAGAGPWQVRGEQEECNLVTYPSLASLGGHISTVQCVQYSACFKARGMMIREGARGVTSYLLLVQHRIPGGFRLPAVLLCCCCCYCCYVPPGYQPGSCVW